MNKIIYLDAAASSLKHDSVIRAEMDFLQNNYANAGRGIYARAGAVDDMVLGARNAIAEFINAQSKQIVFTASATDGLNRVVNILQNSSLLNSASVVAVSDLDHHSARALWEIIAQQKKVSLVKIKLDDCFDIDVNNLPAADVFVITAMSNVFGAPQNMPGITDAIRRQNKDAIIIVDAAQFVAHNDIDADAWGADFICFSGHKIGMDTGLGVMYIKEPEKYKTDKFGGGMINKIFINNDVSDFVFNAAPDFFEAGTLPLTQIAGVMPALQYLKSNKANTGLIKYMYDELSVCPKIKMISSRASALLSFTVDGMHMLDFGALASARGLCVRVGNMCASWAHNLLNISGSIRISVGPYNTMDECKDAVQIIKEIVG